MENRVAAPEGGCASPPLTVSNLIHITKQLGGSFICLIKQDWYYQTRDFFAEFHWSGAVSPPLYLPGGHQPDVCFLSERLSD